MPAWLVTCGGVTRHPLPPRRIYPHPPRERRHPGGLPPTSRPLGHPLATHRTRGDTRRTVVGSRTTRTPYGDRRAARGPPGPVRGGLPPSRGRGAAGGSPAAAAAAARCAQHPFPARPGALREGGPRPGGAARPYGTRPAARVTFGARPLRADFCSKQLRRVYEGREVEGRQSRKRTGNPLVPSAGPLDLG